MGEHARFSASASHRWMACPASLALEAAYPESSSSFADEGTAAHELAQATLLSEEQKANRFLHETIMVNGKGYKVDIDMAAYVQQYVDAVVACAEGGELFVEQRVDYSYTLGLGKGEGFGTSDAIVITADGELQIHDLKYGRGVKVDAEENEQLQLYAVGALERFEFTHQIRSFRLFIHQPRLNHVSEWPTTYDALQTFAAIAADKAKFAAVIEGNPAPSAYAPSEDACRFCKHKANCVALTAKVADDVGLDFENLDADVTKEPAGDTDLTLSQKMAAVDLVESWCKAVRAEVEARLISGREVPGYKLVEGRRGHRKWSDADEAEKALKSMRLKQDVMYDLSLISPTTAQKLAKAGTIGERQWERLQAIITQSQGAPSVAPTSDPRAAITTADDFSDLTELA